MSNIIGIWDAKLQSPIGAIDIVFEFTSGPDGVQGTSTASGELADLQNLQVLETESGVEDSRGDRATFGVDVTKPFRVHLDFDLTFEGNALSGSAKAGMLMPNGPVAGSKRS